MIYRKLSEHYGRGNYSGKTIDETDLQLFADAVSRDAIERRAARRANGPEGGLTGEHLIYSKAPSANIYFYASFHGEDPQRIVDCVATARQDFPELAGVAPVFGGTQIITPAATARRRVTAAANSVMGGEVGRLLDAAYRAEREIVNKRVVIRYLQTVVCPSSDFLGQGAA